MAHFHQSTGKTSAYFSKCFLHKSKDPVVPEFPADRIFEWQHFFLLHPQTTFKFFKIMDGNFYSKLLLYFLICYILIKFTAFWDSNVNKGEILTPEFLSFRAITFNSPTMRNNLYVMTYIPKQNLMKYYLLFYASIFSGILFSVSFF